MFVVAQRCLLLAVVIALLAGCATPTPPPTPTAIPTEPPTSTPLPPTAIAVPTNTPIPPTDTPEPTATPRPTNTPTPLPTNTPKPAPTKAVTPKPTNTKGAAAPASVRVSAKPSDVLTSIQQAFNTGQSLIGQFDALSQKDAAVCAPLLASFNSLLAAPVYDVSAQAGTVQQAYSLYRNAIGMLSAQAGFVRSCGASGTGTLNPAEMGKVRPIIGDAVNQLAQAWELVRYESDASSAASPNGPLLSAIRKAMYDSVALGGTSHSRSTIATPHWWPYPVDVTSYPCEGFRAGYDQVVNAPTFDVNTQTGNVQAAYDKYRKAIATVSDGARSIYEACGRQEGKIVDGMVMSLRGSTSAAHELLSQAFALLNQ
jgi:hypothetical protein